MTAMQRGTSGWLPALLAAVAGVAAPPLWAQDTARPSPDRTDGAFDAAADAARQAEQDISVWRIDSAASYVDFALRLLLVRKLDGRFPYVEGEVRVVDDGASIDVRVDAEAVIMDRPAHAEWARSPEFFDTNRHPWVQFRADGVPLDDLERGGDLTGELTLRGVTREVALTLAPTVCSSDRRRCRVSAQGTVERDRFGMDAKRLVLANDVALSFVIEVVDTGARSGRVDVLPIERDDRPAGEARDGADAGEDADAAREIRREADAAMNEDDVAAGEAER